MRYSLEDDLPAVNPYVVLADLTVALSFMLICFYVSSVWNDEAIWRSDRFKRQSQLEDLLPTILHEEFHIRKVNKQAIKKPAGSYWKEFFYLNADDGTPVAKVQRNSNIQRMQFFLPLFEPGTSDIKPDVANRLAATVARASENVRAGLPYVFLHGIVEEHERPAAQRYCDARYRLQLASDSASGITRPRRQRIDLSNESIWMTHSILLSQNRAARLREFFVRHNIVAVLGTKPDEAYRQNLVPPGDLIPYGTGAQLLTRGGDSPGRVDVILFYAESSRDLTSLRQSEKG